MTTPDDRRYPSVVRDPRELRSKRANRQAALMLLGGILLVIVIITGAWYL